MKRSVLVKPWSKDSSYVHVCTPDCDQINQTNGDVVADASVEEVRRVGEVSGLMQPLPHNPLVVLEGSCKEFARMAEEILEYTPSAIATARQQMARHGVEGIDALDDLAVAYLDWELRDRLADHARSSQDPWQSQLSLDSYAAEVVRTYLERTTAA